MYKLNTHSSSFGLYTKSIYFFRQETHYTASNNFVFLYKRPTMNCIIFKICIPRRTPLWHLDQEDLNWKWLQSFENGHLTIKQTASCSWSCSGLIVLSLFSCCYSLVSQWYQHCLLPHLQVIIKECQCKINNND